MTNQVRFGSWLGSLSLGLGAVVCVVALFASGLTAHAATVTWDAGGGGGSITNGGGAWLNPGLWNDAGTGVNWTSGDDGIFAGPATAGGAVTLASPTTANTLTFNPSFTGTYTLGTAGQALTISNGITVNASAGAATIISPITLGGVQSWTNNSTNALTINSTTNLNGNALTIGGTGTTSFGSNGAVPVISGAGGVGATGGRLFLGAGGAPVHTYSGDTSITGGAVVMISGNASPNSNININGGVLESYWTTGLTRTLGTGGNQLRITGGESGFAMNGSNGATFNLGASINWGDVNFNPSKFLLQNQYSQGTSALTFSSAINLNGANRTIVAHQGLAGTASSTISGNLTNSVGTAGLVKEGAGLLTLTGASNTYNGGTTINAGTLAFGSIAAMPSSGAVAVGTGTTLGIDLGTAGDWTTGTSGVGTLGGLLAGLGGAGSSTVTFSGNVNLRLNVGADSTYSGVIANPTGATSLSLNKVGNSALTLSGINTFTGSLNINAGTVVLSNDNTLSGAVNLNAGALQLANANAIDTATGVAALTGTTLQLRNNSATVFNTPQTTLSTFGTSSMTIDVNRISSGSGNQLTLNGTLFVSNAHGNVTTLNFTGGNSYTLSVPTLRLEASSSGGGGGGLTLNPTTTSVAVGALNMPVSNKVQLLTLGGTTSGNSMGAINNSSGQTLSFAKSGTSTWTLTGSNNYTGTNTISGGTLEVAVMANGGSASGLGQSSNAAGNVLLGNGTTLRYVGSANATSNRSFTINGTAAGHGATIESSGNGTLSFNTPATALAYGTANQTRTLTLGGTNTGLNTFGKILANNGSGATSLVKSGVGRWVLDQANTYTGGTTVSDGTLLVNNTTGSGTGTGAVSISSLATLGGNGTIGGATTIDGFHTPGNSPGIQTFGGGLTYNGTSTLTWELIDNTAAALDRGVDYDGVNVTGGAFSLVTGAEIDLAFGGTVDFLDSFWGTDQEWLVVDLSGGATASDTNLFAIGSITGGANYSPTLGTFGIERKPGSNAADSVYLTWVAVPEPSTIALATFGLIGLGLAARRRFRRKA